LGRFFGRSSLVPALTATLLLAGAAQAAPGRDPSGTWLTEDEEGQADHRAGPLLRIGILDVGARLALVVQRRLQPRP
jgi:hypothetical protein